MMKTSFTLKWKPPENDGGTPITEYIVETKETSKKAWKRVSMTHIVIIVSHRLRTIISSLIALFQIAITKGEATNVTISDLKTDTSYNFRVTAKNNVGTGPPYTAEEAITVGKRPSKF